MVTLIDTSLIDFFDEGIYISGSLFLFFSLEKRAKYQEINWWNAMSVIRFITR